MAKNTQPIAKALQRPWAFLLRSWAMQERIPPLLTATSAKKQSEYTSQLKKGEAEGQVHLRHVLEAVPQRLLTRGDLAPARPVREPAADHGCRLDNVVFRLWRLCSDPPQARSSAGVSRSLHRQRQEGQHPLLPGEGRRWDRSVRSSRSSAKFAKLTGAEAPVVALPAWLNRETGSLKGVVAKLPERSDIDYEVAEHLIVELYSK